MNEAIFFRIISHFEYFFNLRYRLLQTLLNTYFLWKEKSDNVHAHANYRCVDNYILKLYNVCIFIINTEH